MIYIFNGIGIFNAFIETRGWIDGVDLEQVEIADGIFFIEGESKGRYPFSNSVLIDDEVKVLIDTGMGPNLAVKMAKEERIDLVLNSHAHEDHIACNHLFKDAKICSHKLDSPAIRSVSRLGELYGPTGKGVGELIDLFLREVFKLKDSRVDLEFEDGHIFDLGSTRLEVVHAPGHSSGHCCFSVPSERVVFLADIDLTSFGPWYGALDCDIDQFIESIGRIRDFEFEVAIPSHKGITLGRETIREKLDEYMNKIFERERKLLDLLEKERALDEIVDQAIIYGKFPEPKGMYELFEKIMIEKHLERLLRKNLIARTDGGFSRV